MGPRRTARVRFSPRLGLAEVIGNTPLETVVWKPLQSAGQGAEDTEEDA